MARTAGIDEAIAGAGGIVPPARQSQLGLGLPDAPTTAVEPRGAGRPPGAKNKRTEAFIAELEEMGALPGLALAVLVPRIKRETFLADVQQLASELGCTKGEALDRWIRACDILMPYAHQKLPVDLAVTSKGATVFAVVDPAAILGSEQNHGLIQVIEGQVGQAGVGQNGDNADASEG